MNKQTRSRFGPEDDEEIKKYMKVFGHLPNCNTLISEKMNKRIVSKKIRQRWINNLDPRLCHDSFDDNEKSFINEWVEEYKIRNPSSKSISWKELIPVIKKKFGKFRSENKLKNFWHSKERQRRQLHQNISQGPSGINHDTSYPPQYNNGPNAIHASQGSSEFKRDPKMEILHLLN